MDRSSASPRPGTAQERCFGEGAGRRTLEELPVAVQVRTCYRTETGGGWGQRTQLAVLATAPGEDHPIACRQQVAQPLRGAYKRVRQSTHMEAIGHQRGLTEDRCRVRVSVTYGCDLDVRRRLHRAIGRHSTQAAPSCAPAPPPAAGLTLSFTHWVRSRLRPARLGLCRRRMGTLQVRPGSAAQHPRRQQLARMSAAPPRATVAA